MAQFFDTRKRRWAVKLMWLLLALNLVGLLFHGEGFNLLVDGILGTAAQWAPAAVCWLAVRRSQNRLPFVLIALSVTAFAGGTTYYMVALAGEDTLPFPSLADVGFLLFYPFALGGMILFRLTQARPRTVPDVLDGAVGTLGAAAVLAVMFEPLLTPASDDSGLETVVALSYPLLDLLTLAVTAGVITVAGGNVRQRGSLLLLGLAAFSIADVIYAFRLANETYYVGTWLDAGWTVGLCLIAAWADASSRSTEPAPPQYQGNLIIPAVALTAAVGVLVVGTRIPVSGLAVALAGATLLAVGVRTQLAFRQLTALAEAQRQSRTDDLTGLPNRRAFYKDATHRLGTPPVRSRALLLLDVDRFKDVNDSLGHDAGDRLLSQMGERLAACLRSEDLIARMGGDEFAVLLGDLNQHDAVRVAEKLRRAAADPFMLEGIELQTNVSVGIATAPHQGRNLRILMRKADMAMYKAKKSQTGYHLWASVDDEHGDRKLKTLQELRTAVKQDQWVLHYQPKVDLATGEVAGVEALVRWNHPTRGLLMPAAFLHLVEESGLMNELTNQVLERALDQLGQWRSDHCGLTMAVNLSASAFIDARLPERITAMMDDRDLPPGILNLEITEDVMMPERGHARNVIARLRAVGIQVAIDDFGAGHSSIAYLRDLGIDELKLDRSFVTPMTEDPGAAALVASIIQLVHGLGLRVVAEGVENRETFELLRELGCDQGQGFFFSKPLPAHETDRWLRAFPPRVTL